MKEAEKQVESNIFEGMTSIRAVLKSIESADPDYDRKIISVYYDESKKKARASELSYIKAMSYKYGFEVAALPSVQIDEMALGNTHGGLLMKTTARTIPELSPIAIDSRIPKDKRFFVMLEGIEDPYNFGYALRSLYAAGVSAVILTKRNWMTAAGVVCRASAGASELVPMYQAEQDLCISTMHDLGVRIICADMKNSVSIYEANLAFPLFLAIGGEKRGLSRELLDAADEIVRLEYGRDFPAALSAASAATIAGFEVMRRNMQNIH